MCVKLMAATSDNHFQNNFLGKWSQPSDKKSPEDSQSATYHIRKVEKEEFCVEYNSNLAKISFSGQLMLNGIEGYASVLQLLKSASREQGDKMLTLDLTKLEMLNSSGIGTIARFVIDLNEQDVYLPQLKVVLRQGSHWQATFFRNLKKLMPSVEAELAE